MERQGSITYARPEEQASFGPPDDYNHFRKPHSSGEGAEVCNTNGVHAFFADFCRRYGHLLKGTISDWGPGAGVETQELSRMIPNAERIVIIGNTPIDSSRLLTMDFNGIASVIDAEKNETLVMNAAREQQRDNFFDLNTLHAIQAELGHEFFQMNPDDRIEQWIGDARAVVQEMLCAKERQTKFAVQYDAVGAQYYLMGESRKAGHLQESLDLVLQRIDAGGCLFWASVPSGLSPKAVELHSKGLNRHMIIVSPQNGGLLIVDADGEIGTDLLNRGYSIGVNRVAA